MRSHRLPVCLLAALALAAAVPADAAATGSYTVSACSPTSSPGAWQPVDTLAAGMTAGNQCGGPMIGPLGSGDAGALYGEDLIGSTVHSPSGARAGWQFTAPTGTVITAISYYRALSTGLNLDWVAGLVDATGKRLDTCTSNPSPCSSANNQTPVAISGLNAATLFFGMQCIPVSPDTDCLAGSSQHYAQAQMYSAKVTLAETSAPTVSNLGGPLWSGGVVFGTASVTFSGSDVSGISQVALDGPNGQLALQPQSCDYSQTQPCPQLPGGAVSLDTLRLSDGPQTLTLLASNAAGNTLSMQSPPVVVDNNGPPAPAMLTASPVAGSDKAIQLTWSDPLNAPEPVAGANAQLCQASCAAPAALGNGPSARLAVPGPGTYGVRLWLTDMAGRGGPANAATTSVAVPPLSGNGTNPAKTSGLPTLLLSYRLNGHRLTVTLRLPSGASEPAAITLRAYRGARRFALLKRSVEITRGAANLHLTLSATELSATRLSLTATAAHAKRKTILIADRGNTRR